LKTDEVMYLTLIYLNLIFIKIINRKLITDLTNREGLIFGSVHGKNNVI